MRNYQYFFSCPTHPYTSVDKAYADFCTEFESKVEALNKQYTDDTYKSSDDYHLPILNTNQLIEYINILIEGRKPSYVATRAAFDFEQQTFINDDYTTTT